MESLAATATIARLNLNDSSLTALRASAVRGVLSLGGRPLDLDRARRVLDALEADEHCVDAGGTATLMEFAFAVQARLRHHVGVLERAGRT